MAVIIGHSQTKYLVNSVDCPVFSYPGYKVRDFFNEELEFYHEVPDKSVSTYSLCLYYGTPILSA